MDKKRCGTCKQNKQLDAFANKRGKKSSKCKECHNKYYREYWKNTEAYNKHKERQREYKKATKPKRLAAKYGLTIEEYETGISGFCECCLERKAEVVDHDHQTQAVRGFLCGQCNLGIGLLGDSLVSLQQAVGYLKIKYGR